MKFNELTLLNSAAKWIYGRSYLASLVDDKEYIFHRLWVMKLGFYKFHDFNLHITQRDDSSDKLFFISNDNIGYFNLYWLRRIWDSRAFLPEEVDFITMAEWKLIKTDD